MNGAPRHLTPLTQGGSPKEGQTHLEDQVLALCVASDEIMRIHDMIGHATGTVSGASAPELERVIMEVEGRVRPVCDRLYRESCRLLGLDPVDEGAEVGLMLARLLRELDPRIHGADAFLRSARRALFKAE